MPDRRAHRGQHPRDERLFCREAVPALRAATVDLSHLLTRGYAENSSLKLVGDRYELTRRQRLAVLRSACSDQALAHRKQHERLPGACAGGTLLIDGYNLLITVESALSGAFVFVGRDGCYRDLASVHGTYRKVEETRPALEVIGRYLAELQPGPVRWLLDSPVSNSGRLKVLMAEAAEAHGWRWDIQLVQNPDREIVDRDGIAVSSDSWILDYAAAWVNLGRHLLERSGAQPPLVDLQV